MAGWLAMAVAREWVGVAGKGVGRCQWGRMASVSTAWGSMV